MKMFVYHARFFACHLRQLLESLILEVYPQRNSLGRGKTERSGGEGGQRQGE